MQNFKKVREMTAEQAKKIDTNKIEYIALSSGEIVYIKKSEQRKSSKAQKEGLKEKDKSGFDELKKNVIEKETKQEVLKVTQNILDQNQEIIK